MIQADEALRQLRFEERRMAFSTDALRHVVSLLHATTPRAAARLIENENVSAEPQPSKLRLYGGLGSHSPLTTDLR